MKTLEQIKNEVCIKNNFVGWNEFIYTCQDVSIKNRIINELMKIYAMECLKLASENATSFENMSDNDDCNYIGWKIEESIISENNIIK